MAAFPCPAESLALMSGRPEAFLADLDRSWEQHGREILDRVRTDRPKVYFRIMTKLTVALHRALGKLNDFDRQRNREEVLQRLEQSR